MVDFLLRRDEDGQGLAEYALILALIAIIAIAALIFLGGEISGSSRDRRQHLDAVFESYRERPVPSGAGRSLCVQNGPERVARLDPPCPAPRRSDPAAVCPSTSLPACAAA